jgi:hypothetical protein
MKRQLVFESEKPLSADALSEAPHSEERCDWSGVVMPQALRWCLARDPERLWVSIELPAPPSEPRKHGLGDFVEGLWENNVVELFLLEDSGRYQEWNVSSDGAWWAMSFAGYREREPSPVKPEGVAIEIFAGADRWLAILSVPIRSLAVRLGDSTGVHVTGIVYSQEGVPTYFSSAGSPSFNPDFHDHRCFKVAQFVTLGSSR